MNPKIRGDFSSFNVLHLFSTLTSIALPPAPVPMGNNSQSRCECAPLLHSQTPQLRVSIRWNINTSSQQTTLWKTFSRSTCHSKSIYGKSVFPDFPSRQLRRSMMLRYRMRNPTGAFPIGFALALSLLCSGEVASLGCLVPGAFFMCGMQQGVCWFIYKVFNRLNTQKLKDSNLIEAESVWVVGAFSEASRNVYRLE